MTFEEFGFDERIQKGIDEAGFKTPMAVQAQCFQLLIKDHRDIYAQSQTGTGKTAAFLLGIFQLLLTEEKYKGQKALIVVPTRELAVQIESEGKMLGKYLDLNVGCVYGGVGYGGQEKMLADGVDILIGTPGRLIDFHKQRKLNFGDFGFLVIDEADRLFDMGFLPDLRKILKGMKPYNERHTLLFSATLNARVGNLAWEYMNDPGEVIIEPEKVTVDTVTQELYHVGKDEKMKLLLGVLKRDNPENAVIFTNTRHNAWEVAKRLEVNGYSVVFLMGDLPQSKRLRIVEEVKRGDHKYLVATDVAARGLHINELQMVINYDVPLEAESYVHRIGRTARAGKEGKTVTMACEEYVYGLGPIEKLLGQKIPVSWAEEDLMVEDKSAGKRFPPQDRYREMGGGNGRDGDRGRDSRGGRGRSGERSPRNDRRPGDDRRPREDRKPAENRRPNEDSVPKTDSAPKTDRAPGTDRAPKTDRAPRTDRAPKTDRAPRDGQRPPKNGKQPLDPRAVKIQSAVSSIAGGSMDDFGDKKETKNDKRRADARSDRSRSDRPRSERPGKDEGKKRLPAAKKKSTNDRKRPVITEGERVSSENSIDERLEYYKKKYGEDFKLSGSTGSSGGNRKKRKKTPAKPKPQGSPAAQTGKNDSAKKESTPAKSRNADSAEKKEKKGLIGRLFKK